MYPLPVRVRTEYIDEEKRMNVRFAMAGVFFLRNYNIYIYIWQNIEIRGEK